MQLKTSFVVFAGLAVILLGYQIVGPGGESGTVWPILLAVASAGIAVVIGPRRPQTAAEARVAADDGDEWAAVTDDLSSAPGYLDEAAVEQAPQRPQADTSAEPVTLDDLLAGIPDPPQDRDEER